MASLSGLWPAIGRQLQNPSGLGGRLLGVLMGPANRDSNRLASEALKIAPNDTILELGFGSGRALKTLAALAPDGCVLGIDHSAAMLATIAAVSLIVYHWAGVDFLRRGWINLDLIWVAVLATCGVVLLFA